MQIAPLGVYKLQPMITEMIYHKIEKLLQKQSPDQNKALSERRLAVNADKINMLINNTKN